MKKQFLQFRKQTGTSDLPKAENEQGGAGNGETSGANDEANLAQGETGLKGIEENLAQGPIAKDNETAQPETAQPVRTGFETADSVGK